MFTAETLEFLRDLQRNNDRDWFGTHKARYEVAVKLPAEEVAEQVAAQLERATGLRHRAKIYRIYRDLRFSKDPTPYNAHIHLSFVPDAGAVPRPAWMLGLSPDYFTLGCGMMGFDKHALARFRERAAGPDGAALAGVLAALAADGVRLSDPELKRVPAPWPQDHVRGHLLRRKSLTGWIDDTPDAGIGPGMMHRAESGFSRLRPLFDQFLRD